MTKTSVRIQTPTAARCTRARASAFALLLSAVVCLLTPTPAPAQPTQEEVFKSIGENVNEPVDSGRVIAVIAGIAGVILLVAVVGQRRKRDIAPKPLHHHGKLLKEVLGNVSIRGAEMKQLKLIMQDAKVSIGQPAPESPLTLLLCPSLLAQAVKENPAKVDRTVVAGLVKRLVGR